MKNIFSHCTPVVRAGDIEQITVTQTLGNSRLHQDGLNTVNVMIDGPQTALLPDLIAGVYPASGSEDSPDEFLPHIALARRTLPWERQGPEPALTTPWLALLLFKESELRGNNWAVQAPTVGVTKTRVDAITDVVTRNRLMNTLHLAGDSEVNTLRVSNAVLSQVMPLQNELPLLCHVKRSDETGADVDTAIVMCNRLPDASHAAGEKPQLHTAALVSVEQAASLFSISSTGFTTLLVLHHWTFRPSDGGDFEQVMRSIAYRPRGGVLRFGNLPAPVTGGAPAPLSGGFKALLEPDGYFITGVAHDQAVNAAYRGPLRPFGPQPRSNTFAIAAAPNEFVSAPGTPLDFSHAAAFELGRLLALNDAGILEDLRHVTGHMKPMDVPAAVNKLPAALQKPDWVVNPEWSSQPWEGVLGEALVKTETQFLAPGKADVGGLDGHVDQWNVGDLVATLNSIGTAVAQPVAALNVATVSVATLDEQFADVAIAAKS